MAKRMIDTNIWLDGQVLDDFTKNDMILWLYLLTSPQTLICGVVKIPMSLLSWQSKLNKQETLESLENLEKKHKVVKYNKENEEIYILRWHKHNWTTSLKLIDCVEKSLKEVKTKEFIDSIQIWIDRYKSMVTK